MSYAPFSGRDVVKVMMKSRIYRGNKASASGLDPEAVHEWVPTRGDHAILRWNPLADHDTAARTVPVPFHGKLSGGTIRNVADQAGVKTIKRSKPGSIGIDDR
jgi:predicted RNA binding protein YcfA (HicA-like mRNA interferase family)